MTSPRPSPQSTAMVRTSLIKVGSHEIDFHSRGLTMPWNGHWDDRDARDLTFITLPGFVTL